MNGMGSVRVAPLQSCQGCFTAGLVARDEHDPRAHLGEALCGNFTNARSRTRDDNDLTLHMILGVYSLFNEPDDDDAHDPQWTHVAQCEQQEPP
jgi:hypothetical protein